MREQTTGKPTLQPFSPAATGLLQRKCACGQHATDQHGQCTECKKKGQLLQRRAINQSDPENAPPIVHEVLRSPGRPLDAATCANMEPRFEHDFSQIPVHTGAPMPFQAKLAINKPGDKYEQEADRIADQVMRMPDPAVQRQEVLEEEEEDEMLQMKPLAAQITPLVQRETIDEEEEEEVAPVKRSLLQMRPPKDTEQADTAEEVAAKEEPANDVPSDGSDARVYGPTAVPTDEGPRSLSPRNVEQKMSPKEAQQLRNEQLMLIKRPQQTKPLELGRAAVREAFNKGIRRIARKWDVDPARLKQVVDSFLESAKNTAKVVLKVGIKKMAPGPKEEKGIHKDVSALLKDSQELEQELEKELRGKKKKGGGEKKQAVQRQSLAQVPTVTSSVETAVQSGRQSGGKPLDPATRAFMELRFGHDFGHVRVHTDSHAATATRTVSARAFTFGSDIVFGAGQYAPRTTEGRRLLAHELAHTVQQAQRAAPRSIMRAPPSPEDGLPFLTFAQIYLAVQDAKFDEFLDGHLAELDLSELRTLDSLVKRKIEFYQDLARKQEANPKFKPPKGVPDEIFKNVVREYRNFKEQRLDRELEKSERRHKAPELINPWIEEIRKKFASKPIGCAIENTLDITKQIVDAKLADMEFSFSDKGILRLGYLDKAGAYEIREMTTPVGKNTAELRIFWLHQIVKKIRSRKTILPLEMADTVLTAGSGEPGDVSRLNSKIEFIDKQIKEGYNATTQQQLGGTTTTDTRGLPANAMSYWLKRLSDSSENSDSVYTCYG
jgi:hypothetical protein